MVGQGMQRKKKKGKQDATRNETRKINKQGLHEEKNRVQKSAQAEKTRHDKKGRGRNKADK